MGKLAFVIAATAAMVMAGSVSAATRQINFSFGPLTVGGTTTPFGLNVGDTVSGSFQFDDSAFAGAGVYDLAPIMTSLSFTAGSKTWELGDVVDNSLDRIDIDGSNQVTFFRFSLSDADGTAFLSSNNTFNMHPTNSSEFIFCNGCSSFEEVPPTPVPLPASFGFVLAGIGAIGAMRYGLRRRT